MLEEKKETISEEKENQKAEEVSQETEPLPEQDINDLLPSGVAIEKPVPGEKTYDQVIEDARIDFLRKYKNSRRNSYIAMGVVLALAVASVIFIGLKPSGFKIAGWVLIGVALVGMITYYIVTHNTMPNATRAYIKVVNDQMNVRNFSDNKYQNVTVDKDEKLELSDPVSDAIFKNLTNIASRNVVNGKFNDRTFKVGDLGLYSGTGKQRVSAFVGKYLSFTNDLHFEGRYILSAFNDKPVDLPTDIDDLKVLVEEPNFRLYGKEGNKPASDLGKDFLKEIRKVAVEKHLLGYSVVIWSGHSAMYLSYDDAIMALPFEKKFQKEPNEQFANDLLQAFNALDLLNNKKEK
ncbi:MAG: hypothetical protein IJK27_00355 [Bacilli bacterium]|nr:hypothetical protein [Bacilli bacterium]